MTDEDSYCAAFTGEMVSRLSEHAKGEHVQKKVQQAMRCSTDSASHPIVHLSPPESSMLGVFALRYFLNHRAFHPLSYAPFRLVR